MVNTHLATESYYASNFPLKGGYFLSEVQPQSSERLTLLVLLFI
jgi:hypothetical protein